MTLSELQNFLRGQLGGDVRFGASELVRCAGTDGNGGVGDDMAGEPDGDGDSGSNVRWHQVALEGEWKGHFMGPFGLDDQDFTQINRNFEAVKTDLLVDYEHSSLQFGGKAPAAGWANALATRETSQGKGLFARINWTTAAAAHIRAREYRYLSPTLVFTTRDRKTGADRGTSFHSIALTNVPFLDELPDVRLNSILAQLGGIPAPRQLEGKMDPQQLAALAQAFGLPLTATVDQIVAAATGHTKDLAAMTEIARLLTIDEGSSLSQIVGALRATTERLTLAETQVGELSESAAKIKAIEAAQRYSKARSEGKIVKANDEWAKKLAASDPEQFDAWAASAPVIVPQRGKDPPKRAPEGGASDEELAPLALAAGQTIEEFRYWSEYDPIDPKPKPEGVKDAPSNRWEGQSY